MSYHCPFPSYSAIDYEPLMAAARAECCGNPASFLREHLPPRWCDVYVSAAEHPTNLVRFRYRSFEYICDMYSQLEALGEVAYNQTIQDRVVAVLGESGGAEKARVGSRLQDRREAYEELLVSERDNGHFMAHCIGGGLAVNVFSQDRRLNRGWSLQGKVYRQMETYCYERPGTFCFSRPIYADGSNIPRWLEFGLLKDDDTLWVEVFDN